MCPLSFPANAGALVLAGCAYTRDPLRGGYPWITQSEPGSIAMCGGFARVSRHCPRACDDYVDAVRSRLEAEYASGKLEQEEDGTPEEEFTAQFLALLKAAPPFILTGLISRG